jgi:NitT/TauT family transport system substrate-binding protein
MHQVLDGKEAMGEEFTFIVTVTTYRLHDDHPEIYHALVQAIGRQ